MRIFQRVRRFATNTNRLFVYILIMSKLYVFCCVFVAHVKINHYICSTKTNIKQYSNVQIHNHPQQRQAPDVDRR